MLLFWVCVFAWWAGRWFWIWWPAPSAGVFAGAPVAVADAGPLMSARVFGHGLRASPAGGPLRLVGVNTDSRHGFALVELNGKAQFFVRGDTLPDGRRIADIAADRLLLERGGREEVLPLLDRGPAR